VRQAKLLLVAAVGIALLAPATAAQAAENDVCDVVPTVAASVVTGTGVVPVNLGYSDTSTGFGGCDEVQTYGLWNFTLTGGSANQTIAWNPGSYSYFPSSLGTPALTAGTWTLRETYPVAHAVTFRVTAPTTIGLAVSRLGTSLKVSGSVTHAVLGAAVPTPNIGIRVRQHIGGGIQNLHLISVGADGTFSWSTNANVGMTLDAITENLAVMSYATDAMSSLVAVGPSGASKTTTSLDSTTRHGKKVTIKGNVVYRATWNGSEGTDGQAAGQRVQVQVKNERGWKILTTLTATNTGAVAYTRTAAKRATYRLHSLGSPTFTASTSVAATR
jgi:hypothetical protein